MKEMLLAATNDSEITVGQLLNNVKPALPPFIAHPLAKILSILFAAAILICIGKAIVNGIGRETLGESLKEAMGWLLLAVLLTVVAIKIYFWLAG